MYFCLQQQGFGCYFMSWKIFYIKKSYCFIPDKPVFSDLLLLQY